MAVFRSIHIKPYTIAMVPVLGYTSHVNYSADSIRWMDFISNTKSVYIDHALNGNGERKVGGVYVDGYSEDTKTVYQFHVSYAVNIYLKLYTYFVVVVVIIIFAGLLFPWV